MDDQRLWPRANVALDVVVFVEGQAEPTRTCTVNISREGIFLAVNPPHPIGSKLHIKLALGNRDKLILEGIVVRTIPDPEDPLPRPDMIPGVGILLTQTSAGWTRLCDELVKRERTS